MQEQISILVRVLPSGKEVTIAVQPNMLGAKLKKMLIEHPELQAPTIDPDGNLISYKLSAKSTGKEVNDESTIKELNIEDGDTLLLAPSIVAGGASSFVSLKTVEFFDWLNQKEGSADNLTEEIINAYLEWKGIPLSVSFTLRNMPSGEEFEIEAPLSAKLLDLFNHLIESSIIPKFDVNGNLYGYELMGSKPIAINSSETLFEVGLIHNGTYLLLPVLPSSNISSFKSLKNLEFFNWLNRNGYHEDSLTEKIINEYLEGQGMPLSVSFTIRILPGAEEYKVVEMPFFTKLRNLHYSLVEEGVIPDKANDGSLYSYFIGGSNYSKDSRSLETIFEVGFVANGIYFFTPNLVAGWDGITSLHLIEFNDWLNEKYKGVNIFSSIPGEKMNQLIQRFCEDKNYEDVPLNFFINPFKQKLFSPFSYQKRVDKFRMVFNAIFNRKKYKEEVISYLFKRYQEIKFHGFFLFAQGDDTYRNIYKKYWEDINQLTSNYMDLYFAKEDLEGKSGFETLNWMTSINHLSDEIILPALIIWNIDQGLKNAISIPLKGFNTDYVMFILQLLVKAIKKKLELREIGIFVQQKIETSFITPTSLNVTYIEKQEAENIFNIENLKNT